MRSWSQLESGFRDLRGSGFGARIDHFDGDVDEQWNLAAFGSSQAESHFKALARMAGEKLLDVPAAVEWPGVAEERDPVVRWYRALRQLPGAFRSNGYGVQKDEKGNDAGFVIMESIQSVYQNSATLCAALEALASTPRRRAELLCAGPRYAGPCEHWRAAQSALAKEEPDYAAAAHAAVSAVEGLCRIILGDDSITLGEAVKRMRSRGLLHSTIAKSIEGLWGFASNEPGVRHGATKPTAVKSHDAEFVVEACDAAIVLLLSIDEG